MVYVAMWKLKSCPRCGGDTFIERELDVWYEWCLQCGYERDIISMVKVHQHSNEEEQRETVQATYALKNKTD